MHNRVFISAGYTYMSNAPLLSDRIQIDALIKNAARAVMLAALFCTISLPAKAASVIGDSGKWSPLTLDFTGVSASETDTSPNPFLDYRLTVVLKAPSGRTLTVPGFFAGDGNGFGTGNHWQARFAADEIGTWQYKGVLHAGADIAIDTNLSNGSVASLDAASGSFNVVTQSENAPGFLKHGRLEYVGEHYMKFSDGPYWIKAGTDSPENILGFAGIDGTVDQNGNFLHRFDNHIQDAESTDPQFSNAATGVDNRGLTGALNYLSDQGINSIYFLPMNLGGDGQETFPFVGGTKTTFNKTHYDISKLHQWNALLSHAQQRGIALNVVLSETEPDNENWLDNGKLGRERKLYFRELIARFGYLLAVKWNLGEENDFPVSELRAHADYISALDWSEKPIAVHTQINNFRDYEIIVGDPRFDGTSIQYHQEFAGQFVEQWRTRSAQAGHPWVIDMDENTNGVSSTDFEQRRKQILYDVLFSGGNIEWYFGYYPMPLGGDITAGDFRLREGMWKSTTIARKFMEQELPFWRMDPMDSLVNNENQAYGGAEVFAAPNEVYAIYLPNANGNQTIDLSNTSGDFVQQWFNPSSGSFEGNSRTLASGKSHNLGTAPSRTNDDWVILIRSNTAPKPAAAVVNNTPTVVDAATPDPVDETPTLNVDNNNDEPLNANPVDKADNALPELMFGDVPVATVGENYSLKFTAIDDDGVAPVVTADVLPAGISLKRLSAGVFELNGLISESMGKMMTVEIIAIDVRFADVRVVKPVSIAIQPAPDEPAVNELNTDTQVADVSTPAQVLVGDKPPIILGARDLRVPHGSSVKLTIVPVDLEGIVPALRVIKMPAGSTFGDNGNGTRTFGWTPTENDVGEHVITFVATDAGTTPHVVQKSATIVVVESIEDANSKDQDGSDGNHAPFFRAIADKSVASGDTIAFRVVPVDPEGIVPILHLLNPPKGSSFKDNGDGSRTFEWVASGSNGHVIELEFVAIDTADSLLTSTLVVPVTLVP